MRLAGIVIIVAIGMVPGCMRSSLVSCGDERLCPADRLCHAKVCVTQPQIDVCAALADEETCSFGGVTGYCDSGYCRPARCGDGVVDQALAEVCDDGNDDNGDMCSADCQSLEDCGNGRIDVGTTEQCDDGNRADTDGCQANCQLARCGDGILDALNDEACDNGALNSSAPDACRPNCQLARCGDGVKDLLSGEVCDDGNLAFGDGCRPDCASNESCGNGIVDFTVGETCDDANAAARDGCSGCLVEVLRSRVVGATSPSPRFRGAMELDWVRNRIVLFGGTTGGAWYGDTWEKDGDNWVQMSPPTSPSSRSEHAMVYDAKRHRVVLFGGRNSLGQVLGDTWEWDGVTWTRLASSSSLARARAVMAYDAVRQRIVMFGGYLANNTILRDTWELDGATWVEQAPATFPATAQIRNAFAYDPIRNESVLWLGETSQTFVWNGITWTERIVTGPPAGEGVMTFDPGRRHIVMYLAAGPARYTAEWNGTAWTTTATGPTARTGAMITSNEGYSTMFGGQLNGAVPTAEIWVREDNGSWHLPFTPDGPPPERFQAAMATDPVGGGVLLYGGSGLDKVTGLTDTWEWYGSGWSLKTPSTTPGPVPYSSAVYDPVRARMLVLGGFDYLQESQTNAVWEWDGSNWSSQPAMPGPIQGTAAAFDPISQRVIVHGGTLGGSDLSSSYVRTGTAWSVIASTMPARHRHAMATDPVRGRIVLYGGRTQTVAQRYVGVGR